MLSQPFPVPSSEVSMGCAPKLLTVITHLLPCMDANGSLHCDSFSSVEESKNQSLLLFKDKNLLAMLNCSIAWNFSYCQSFQYQLCSLSRSCYLFYALTPEVLLDNLLQWNFLSRNTYILLPDLLLMTALEMASSGFLPQASGTLRLALAEHPFSGIHVHLS